MLTFVVQSGEAFYTRFRILAASIKRWHPDWPIVLYRYGQFTVHEDVQIVSMQPSLCMFRDRARIVEEQLAQHEKICVLGADTELFDTLHNADGILNSWDFAVVPHLCEPSPNRRELEITRAGICNSDLQLWHKRAVAAGIVSWYKDRLGDTPSDPIAGYTNEQSWLSLIPTLFDNCLAWRTRSLNISYWNCFWLREEDGRYYNGDVLVRLFHYSGFNPDLKRSVYEKETPVNYVVRKLYEEYARKLAEAA